MALIVRLFSIILFPLVVAWTLVVGWQEQIILWLGNFEIQMEGKMFFLFIELIRLLKVI